ncbi:TRAP transporter small permease subunit [Hydrogenophaga sp.]|uniref:TRAP transporter small permease subunit n=1 Tax=Hydrogenophaga sp. TaxID=1904254 RepID=UPI002715F6D9|nr:TRAP transporter small permease [Hydrogenophaga sp.]MDO9437047.1 TRAP transporter small permease [Hydrogenophaga sp.]
MRRGLDAVYTLAGALAAACVLLIGVLMLGQSILREFGVATGATSDVVGWLCAAAAFLGLAHTFKHGDIVRVTLVIDMLSPPARQRLEAIALALVLPATGYLAWWATYFTWESWAFEEVASGLLPLPMWIPQSTLVVGAWLLFVAVFDELLIVLSGRRPTYVVAAEQRHAQGDFSSDI